MNILIIGNGAREHALCWSVKSSPLCHKLYCCPGNAGISKIAECIAIDPLDNNKIIDFVQTNQINFVIIGPEAPLINGIVNQLEKIGVKTFGPTAEAAILEGSKVFTKNFCLKYNIPTAAYKSFTDPIKAKEFITQINLPCVIKADGLAGGKGVIIASTLDEANKSIDLMLHTKAFGQAGSTIIIEEYLEGEEISFFALSDGTTGKFLACAQDHKRIGENDTGLNTGGMGAYTPVPFIKEQDIFTIMQSIIEPTIKGMGYENKPFKGVLFAGLMMTKNGPKLLEYNVRFGDPECQVICMLLKSDLLELLYATLDRTLKNKKIDWHPGYAIDVIMASQGYPQTYKSGTKVIGLENIETNNTKIFHYLTSFDQHKNLTINSGRGLAITSKELSLKKARDLTYATIKKINWPEGYYRRDIAERVLEKNIFDSEQKS
ncbi:MAG: phosphoribosylamine--glycine ligase [Alphaproteobacteria bacterium]|nr:phosphoribosylamine--glycine ligase [Alphaproteobacteria bacterium]